MPTHNGYRELRKVMSLYNANVRLSVNKRIDLIEKQTGFSRDRITDLIIAGKATEYPLSIIPYEDDEEEDFNAIPDALIEDHSVSLFKETWQNICKEHFLSDSNMIMPKDKPVIELSTGVCLDCFGIFEPYSYAEISLMQGESGKKALRRNVKQLSKNISSPCAGSATVTALSLIERNLKKKKVN